jgi:TetR/AcrR family transcriptional regulator, regulator of biofilm formation and stress response
MGMESTSGGRRRQQRGEERRRALVESALRLVEAGGPEAVTHRRVAEEAGLPLASTTYYFDSKDDLMEAVIELHMQRTAARLARLAERVTADGASVADGVQTLVLALLQRHRREQLAELELALHVARTRPGTRPLWTTEFRALAEAVLRAGGAQSPERDASALVALVYGLVLQGLTTDEPDFADVVAAALSSWVAQAFPQA